MVKPLTGMGSMVSKVLEKMVSTGQRDDMAKENAKRALEAIEEVPHDWMDWNLKMQSRQEIKRQRMCYS
jgi:hypothetical protein